ncbi:MAG TPA: ATP-grasp domain-containing protein [Candidatus Ozemobacteraceae bacterium]|nr:ATP-grasp domain-containing protein [Candidatus Ozemobacteraceae bacterium]
MKVLILSNAPAPNQRWEAEERSDRGVLDAVSSISQALKANGHVVATGEIGERPEDLLQLLDREQPDTVFNLCETIRGNSRLEPAVPFLLRWRGVPFSGNGPQTISILLEKTTTKRLLRDHRLPTPAFHDLVSESDIDDWYIWPAILKPAAEDASLGIDAGSVVRDREAARERFRLLAERFGTPVLIEQYIDGRELNVAVLETSEDLLLGVNEIDFSEMPEHVPHIVTYNAKWVEESAEFLKSPVRAPANLPPEIDAEVRRLVRQTFAALHLAGYARIDLRLDTQNQPWILEVNPNPDISPGAGFVKALPEMGVSYEQAIEIIVQRACRTKGIPR